jgi:hypothetical protein
MKTYNQFIEESHSARENIQEAIPLALIGAGKALSYGLAAYQAYQAAQKLRKGDYKGAAFDAALAIPSAGVAGRVGQALKWGQRGKNITTNVLRTAKAGAITADALREPSAATGPVDPSATSSSSSSSTKPVETKPTTQPKPSSVVLARKGGVMGKLDKATGKWTKGDWTKQESDRYKRVAAQKAAPKPAPVVKSNNINLPSAVAVKSAAKKSTPVGETIKTKVNPDSSLEVTQKRSKAATEKIKKSLDIN